MTSQRLKEFFASQSKRCDYGLRDLINFAKSYVSKKPVVTGVGFTTDDDSNSFSKITQQDGVKAVLREGATLMPLGHIENPARYLVLIKSTGRHVVLDTEIVNVLFKKD